METHINKDYEKDKNKTIIYSIGIFCYADMCKYLLQ